MPFGIGPGLYRLHGPKEFLGPICTSELLLMLLIYFRMRETAVRVGNVWKRFQNLQELNLNMSTFTISGKLS